MPVLDQLPSYVALSTLLADSLSNYIGSNCSRLRKARRTNRG
jgi:hypothetical protein